MPEHLEPPYGRDFISESCRFILSPTAHPLWFVRGEVSQARCGLVATMAPCLEVRSKPSAPTDSAFFNAVLS